MALSDLSQGDFEQLMDELRPPRNLGTANSKQSLFQLERVGVIEVELDGDMIVMKMPQSDISPLRIRRRG